jgi:hypothetical protein
LFANAHDPELIVAPPSTFTCVVLMGLPGRLPAL